MFDGRRRIQIVLTIQVRRPTPTIYNLNAIESVFNTKKKKKSAMHVQGQGAGVMAIEPANMEGF